MPGLGVVYSQNIQRDLGKTAIFPPNAGVGPGDIILFPAGHHPATLGVFWVTKPIGSFHVVNNIENLGYTMKLVDDRGAQTFTYGSKKGTKVSLLASAGVGPASRALTKIEFVKDGAVYLVAAGCRTQRIDRASEILVHDAGTDPDLWENTFIVLSVTTAAHALVMQSRSAGAELVLEGDVAAKLPAAPHFALDIQSSSNADFIMPWSENVTLFMDVKQFSKDHFLAKH